MYIEPAVIVLISIAIGITFFCLLYSIKSKNATIEIKNNEIEIKNKENENLYSEIRALRSSIRDKEAEIRQIQKEINNKNQEILELKQSNYEKSAKIIKLAEEIKKLTGDIGAKEQEISILKKDVEFYSNIKAASEGLNDTDEDDDITLPDLDEEQKAAFDLMMNTNQNLFITGKAGTGKSALLRVFAKSTTKCLLKLAPTGIAAININGATIHSAFGFFNLVKVNYDEISEATIKLNSDKIRVLTNVHTIIIDEISMVRSDILEKVDRILKLYNKTDRPFGGKQMIFFGDLFQLPPIAKSVERRYILDTFGGLHFFYSFAYKRADFKFIELTVNHRQVSDEQFFNVLNEIREGQVPQEHLDMLNERTEYDEIDLRTMPRLFSKKEEVEKYNKEQLEKNIGKEFLSKAVVLFPENGKYPNAGKNDKINFETRFPVTENLVLKKGALVMFVKNNGDKWVNGTLGMVSEIESDKIRVSVNNEDFDVYPEEFEELEAKYENGTIAYHTICKIAQYPIILAYAMTIHKSQGQTYGKVACDVTECFAPGQAYVALSRVRSLNGLFLLSKVEKHHIQIDTEIEKFYQSFAKSKKQLRQNKPDLAKPIPSNSHIPFNPPIPALSDEIEMYKTTGTAPFDMQMLCEVQKECGKYERACRDSFEIVEKSTIKYRVRSCESDKCYWVNFHECDCKSNQTEHRPCKHMIWLAYTHNLIPKYTAPKK